MAIEVFAKEGQGSDDNTDSMGLVIKNTCSPSINAAALGVHTIAGARPSSISTSNKHVFVIEPFGGFMSGTVKTAVRVVRPRGRGAEVKLKTVDLSVLSS